MDNETVNDRVGDVDTGRTEHLEREMKWGATPELELPGLQGVTHAMPLLPPQQLTSTYFDTADFRLFERNITFRHRVGEESGEGVWTLKLPGKTGARVQDRTEISWPGTRATVPAEARRIVRGIVRHSELKPVVTIDTNRRRRALRDAHGTTWAELDDDTVTVSGGPQDGLRFRQIEIELTSETDDRATRSLFKEVVRQLRTAGACPENESKLAKALGPAVAVGHSRDQEAELGPQVAVSDVVRASIARSFDRILSHDVLLRLQPYNPLPEDVHQSRLGTRRLRADLKTFGPVLDPVWVGHVRADLRWVGTALGTVRDADVLMHRLDLASGGPTGDDDIGRHELRDRITEQRRQAAAGLVAALEEERYFRLLDRLHAASSLPPFLTHHREDERGPEPTDLARKAMPELVARSWRPLHKRARKAARHRPTDAELHQARIKAKQVRYASEAAASVVGSRARRTAKAAENLQTVLGDHHDAVTAEAWLTAVARQSTLEASFTAGLLAAEQRRLQEKLRRRWKSVWHDLEASTGWWP